MMRGRRVVVARSTFNVVLGIIVLGLECVVKATFQTLTLLLRNMHMRSRQIYMYGRC